MRFKDINGYMNEMSGNIDKYLQVIIGHYSLKQFMYLLVYCAFKTAGLFCYFSTVLGFIRSYCYTV